MKILFYNIFLYKNGQPTTYPLERFIDDIFTKESIERLKRMDGKYYKLSKVEIDNSRNENREMWFGKYRAKKPYTGSLDRDELEEIEADIIEPVLLTLIPRSQLLLLEASFYGANYLNFQNYLNLFIEQTNQSEDDWEVKIIAIKSESQYSLIRNSSFIKSIVVDYEVGEYDYARLLQGEYEKKSVIVELLQKNAEVTDIMGSKVSTVVWKKGRYKDPIDIAEAFALFGSLVMDDDILKDVRVIIRENNGNDRSISLKTNGHLYEMINVDGDGFDVIRRATRDEFYGGLNQRGANNFTKYRPLLEADYSCLVS